MSNSNPAPGAALRTSQCNGWLPSIPVEPHDPTWRACPNTATVEMIVNYDGLRKIVRYCPACATLRRMLAPAAGVEIISEKALKGETV